MQTDRPQAASSLNAAYAERLDGMQSPLWKRVLGVQAPYRWNLRRLRPGRTLDVGCGIGRNLAHLEGQAVGVDPNSACVDAARAAGFEAYTPDMLPPGEFDTLLFAHVLEHMDDPAALIAHYLGYLRPDGRVILITPQEAGYRSDDTHMRFLDLDALSGIAEGFGLKVERRYSFPFPRWVGRLFRYNEFVVIARRG